ncbi:hypothetical protein C4552_02295 [Candidatus Parcubacteria bacterium]|nr:MAG: hypothetical protein C4552_02295 [Candidatus Parcubacteria bacterium]
MIHIISYTLHSPGRDYSSLHEAIRSLSGSWWHHTTSVWLVDTSLSAQQIYDRLAPHLDRNDELIVFGLTREWWGRIDDQEGLTWLRGRTF